MQLHAADRLAIERRYAVLKGIRQFSGKQPVYFRFSSPTPGVPLCDIYSLTFAR